MIFCVDLDGTLCSNTFGAYDEAIPFPESIGRVNALYSEGHKIIIFTARGSGSGVDWKKITESQLKEWGVNYSELSFGKPEADFYIDDRAISAFDWLSTADFESDHDVEYFHNYILSATKSMLAGTSQVRKLIDAARIVTNALRNGNKVMWCGNGGSAADAQHLAAELVGRFAKNRDPLSSIALTTDSSVLTALGNDYGFEKVFSRQVKALGKNGDVLIGISTSGNSANVVNAVNTAKSLQISTIAFTGKIENQLTNLPDVCLRAQSEKTSHIQESHIAWGQAICGYAEKSLFTD